MLTPHVSKWIGFPSVLLSVPCVSVVEKVVFNRKNSSQLAAGWKFLFLALKGSPQPFDGGLEN
jgi:hypothetical protein